MCQCSIYNIILTLNVLNANELKNERMSIQINIRVSNGKAQLSRTAILTEKHVQE